MKIGFDFHGVLDAKPEFFSKLSKLFVNAGHEVHIITGQEDSPEIRQQLEDFDIQYTHFFSITNHHKSIGTKVWYDEKNTPWMDEEVWNKTKAMYCLKHGIDLHLDDSNIFGTYFLTPYAKFERKDNGN